MVLVILLVWSDFPVARDKWRGIVLPLAPKGELLVEWMCGVAIDRAAKIASFLHNESYSKRWREAADIIKEDVLENGWNEEIQSFSQSYGSTDLDASLLLMEAYGFISEDNPKYIKTVDAIFQSLNYKGLMYRYNNKDDFGKPTSAFTICTFWMIHALLS